MTKHRYNTMRAELNAARLPFTACAFCHLVVSTDIDDGVRRTAMTKHRDTAGHRLRRWWVGRTGW